MSLSPTQRLFNLHLHIKKSIVNNQRNIEEVKRLRLNFEKQLHDLILSLYFSSKSIWNFSYNSVESIKKGNVSAQDDVQTIDAPNVTNRILAYLNQSKSKMNEIISNDISKNNDHLSLNAFLLILSTFHFIWSQEQINLFTQFLKECDTNIREKIYICFLVQPLTQIYFVNCLQPIFSQIQGKTTNELKDILIEKMKIYAPLFPEFLRNILTENSDRSNQIFWNYFMKPFLSLSSLFGLTHPEFNLYCNEQYQSLLTELTTYFNSDESKELIQAISTCSESLSMLPSEELLIQVDPNFITSTLIDSFSFEASQNIVESPNIKPGSTYILVTHNVNASSTNLHVSSSPNLTTSMKHISKPRVVLDTAPVFTSTNNLHIQPIPSRTKSSTESFDANDKLPSMTDAETDDTDSTEEIDVKTKINKLAKNFLKLARLVKLESDDQPVSSCFSQLADFSSIDGNGDIEQALDSLLKAIPQGTTLDDICANLEEEIGKETTDDTLMCLSEYSAQNLYISKLKDVIDNVSKNGQNVIEFAAIQNLMKQIQNDPQMQPIPKPDEVISNPSLFVRYYEKCSNQITNQDPHLKPTFLTYRNLVSIILHDLNILNLFEKREDLKKFDEETNKIVHTESEYFLSAHHQPFLDVYREDQSRLKMFFDEFDIAFKCKQPFEKIYHIHSAYQVLTGLLTMQGIGEIGADQIVPFATVAMVYSNPMGLASTNEFLSNYISPLFSIFSPLDHAEEYSVIQFLSTFQFVIDKMKEKGVNIDIPKEQNNGSQDNLGSPTGNEAQSGQPEQ